MKNMVGTVPRTVRVLSELFRADHPLKREKWLKFSHFDLELSLNRRDYWISFRSGSSHFRAFHRAIFVKTGHQLSEFCPSFIANYHYLNQPFQGHDPSVYPNRN